MPRLCLQVWTGGLHFPFWLIESFKDDGGGRVKRTVVVRLVPRKKGHEPGH